MGIRIEYILLLVQGSVYFSHQLECLPKINPCKIFNVSEGQNLTLSAPSVNRLVLENASFSSFNERHFKQLPPNVHELSFLNGKIGSVVLHSKHLQSLEISNTSLRSFTVFRKMNNVLKELIITTASLTFVSESIGYLGSLEQAIFRNCRLRQVNLDVFADLHHLTVLDLSHNKLQNIRLKPEVRLRSLKRLLLHGNRLQFMHGFPESFPALKYTSLFQNNFLCDWVTPARSAIWLRRITVVGFDSKCGTLENNGGICCRVLVNPDNEMHYKHPTPSDRGYFGDDDLGSVTPTEQVYMYLLSNSNETKVELLNKV